METKILQSKLLAVTSPFNGSFNIDSDINKLLWAAFAGGIERYECVYKPRKTDGLIWPQATEVLEQIRIKTGEVLYFLAECLNRTNQKAKAIEFWEESVRLGFKQSERKEGPVELVNDDNIEYATYKEVFGVEV
ncbi:MAG: hypothetical protein FJX18_05750 [Alphaproteobacteria bacterium]|nr:hypothetical protein [Alphaproteobacteria bacterium]